MRTRITREYLIGMLEESLFYHRVNVGQQLSRTEIEPIIATFIFMVAREDCIQNG